MSALLNPVTLLALALVGVVAYLLVERFVTDPVLAARFVFALSVLTTFWDDTVRPPNFGGVTVTGADVVFGLLLAATVLRALRRRGTTVQEQLLAVLGLLVVFSTLRGIPAFGPQPALRETRIFLNFIGGALYFGTAGLTVDQRNRIARLLVMAGVGFCAITAFRWAAMVAGAPPAGIFVRAREPGVRVIDNQNTLIIVQALFVVAPLMLRNAAPPWMRRFAVLCVPFLLGLQHRTIWLVALAGATVFTIQRPALGRKLAAIVAVIGVLGGVVMIALLDDQSSALQQAPTDTRSLVWRVDGWQGLLTQQDQTAITFAVGKPMGGGFERLLETSGNLRDTSPHNFYIESLLRVGAAGLVLLVAIYASTILSLRRRPDLPGEVISSSSAVVLLTTQLIFMLAWGPDMDQGLVLGLCLSLLTGQSPLDTESAATVQTASQHRPGELSAASVDGAGRRR